MRTLTASVITLGAVALAAPARADDSFSTVTLGVVFSVPLTGGLDQFGLGVAASWMHYPDGDRYLGAGAFAQAQLLFGGGARFGFGFQPAAWVAGAELGVAVMSPRGRPVEVGLHLAPYLSIGYTTAGVRYTHLLSGDGRGLDFTLAGNLWFEWKDGAARDPYSLRRFEAVPGRPLVIRGRARVAPVTASAAWRDHAAPAADDLGADDRRALADVWTRAMLDEHASVAAFARASLQLMALGAPPDLVARAHRAALDEVDHARRCAGLASRFAGVDVGPGALPEACAPIAALDHAALAAATVREGCLGEGVAARLAARSLARAADPAVREALTVIARDEAEHARFAWDVVAWCVARGGAAAREAVAAALRAAPTRVPAGEASARLEGLGVASGLAQRAAYTHQRRDVMRRWHGLRRAA